MTLKITTWNVNSVRIRLPLIKKFMAEEGTDILCLQETKCPDGDFPHEALAALGFVHRANWGMKGYNGVAILSKYPLNSIERHTHLGNDVCRHLSAKVETSLGHITLHNLYIPSGHGEADLEKNPKYGVKLNFVDELITWFPQYCDLNEPMIVLGDLNIAPLENDVWDHKKMLKSVSHTPAEIERFTKMIAAAGFIDAMRHFVPETEKLYTWWTYRTSDWKTKARGRRLDHIFITKSLIAHLSALSVLKDARGWDRPSDHVPVSLVLA